MSQFKPNQIRRYVAGRNDYYFIIVDHYKFNDNDYYLIKWLIDKKVDRLQSCSDYWMKQYSREFINDTNSIKSD